MKEKLFDKNYIKNLCKQYNLDSLKEWGQHFLLDKKVINKIIEVSEITSEDEVVEIGPGFGTLTFALSKLARKVIAFEIEKRLKPYWEQNKTENINIIWGNGLENFKNNQDNLFQQYKFVANLPYQITSRIIRTVLEAENKPDTMTVMVQKEVATRICADKDKSKLTVAVKLFGEPKLIREVPRESFYPPPRVDSAILTVENIQSPEIDKKNFFKVVSAGFAHRRKQLKNNLSTDLGIDKQQAGAILGEITGKEKIRAQRLSLEDWKQLCEQLRDNDLI
ncbi:MAG: ribosomal RNA small subunit methyltransferase A [Parcubacteria group bacterium QH_9_35_7]|nr:MAG: ribosomal RNA small subunit methyltransferase A [Parcubacteria group bacterium QH_9_35_7]